MKKIPMLIAAGAGYVLGARAGRERYEQIKARASRVARDPRVQDATEKAKDKAGEVASDAAEAARRQAADVADAARRQASVPPTP